MGVIPLTQLSKAGNKFLNSSLQGFQPPPGSQKREPFQVCRDLHKNYLDKKETVEFIDVMGYPFSFCPSGKRRGCGVEGSNLWLCFFLENDSTVSKAKISSSAPNEPCWCYLFKMLITLKIIWVWSNLYFSLLQLNKMNPESHSKYIPFIPGYLFICLFV